MLDTHEIFGWLTLGFFFGIAVCAVLCERYYGATPADADHDIERWRA